MDECLIYSVDTQFIDEMATTTIWEGRGFVFRFSHTLFLTFFRSFSLSFFLSQSLFLYLASIE